MERIVQAKVIRVEKPPGKTSEEQGETSVVLQCPVEEIFDKKAKVIVPKAIFKEQDTMIATNDCIKVRGRGKTAIKEGDTVEVRIISNPPR